MGSQYFTSNQQHLREQLNKVDSSLPYDYTSASPGSVVSNHSLHPALAHSATEGKRSRKMSKKGFNMNEEEGQSFEDTGNSSTSSLPKVVKRVKTTTVKGKGKGKVKQEGATGESDFDVNGNGKKGVRKMRKTSSDRKKTSRACGSCQKAHLTCDDARPCARCVKRGTQDSCQDGIRKKAKYLQEVPDEMLDPRSNMLPPPLSVIFGGRALSPDDDDLLEDQSPPHTHSMLESSDPNNQPFSFDSMAYYDTNTFANEFGSEAANLEYAILSSMLNGNGFSDPIDTYSNQDTRFNGSADGNSMLIQSPLGVRLALPTVAITAMNTGGYTSASSPPLFEPRSSLNQSTAFTTILSPPTPNLDLFTDSKTTSSSSLPPPLPSTSGSLASTDLIGTFAKNGGPASSSTADYAGRTAQSMRTLTGEEAYRNVTKPYPYAQSYHYLVRHLKERFEKNDILRIIRALATFRPSLIALQMPLTEEDETFVERTFQRTLVELNKLISFSGTPTVVWRRTGEICLVGTEFCLLTGWSREELLGKKYIFELFDTSSVVEYYESFAQHAFESTSSSVMTQCVVLGPSGRPVPCAFCFSVRRDLFSLPFLVIGSFLPILLG